MSLDSSELVFGLHSVHALLKQNSASVEEVFLLHDRKDKRLQMLIELIEEKQILAHWCNRKKLDSMVNGKHQGVIARRSSTAPEVYDEAFLKSQLSKIIESQKLPFLLILDGITDPHNLGACLRSANAAGVHFVIAPKDNSASLSPTVIKVACGAAETVPLIRVTNLSRTMKWLQQQNIWILGATSNADKRYDLADMKGALAIVMGSEGKGLRRLTRENCDSLVSIPMIGNVSSLNVSVATGICLFEAVRQRQ